MLVVVFIDVFGAVLLLHRVNELGCLRVAEVGKAGDVESSHHVVVLVDEVVAVEHVDTIVWGVAGDDGDLLVGTKQDDVLQGFSFVGKNASFASGAAQDLEVDEMDMHGMAPAAG